MSTTHSPRPLAQMALADLLDAFASNEPVPGGGSAAALAGALGASLLIMVAGLPRTKTGAPEEAADLAEASARLRPIRDSLLALVDEDSRAYTAVLQARRLPQETEAEKKRRYDAVDAAMREATRVPMDTMRGCQQALRGAMTVAESGNANAATDTGTAVQLLIAGVRSAGMNVDVNLRSVSDAAFAERTAAERRALTQDAEPDARRVLDHLDLRT